MIRLHSRCRAAVSLAMLGLAPSAAAAGPGTASAAEAELEIGTGAASVIPVQVNGRPLRLKVDFGAPGFVILNPAAARRAGLKPSLLPVVARIGPVTLKGKTRAAKIVVAGVASKKRMTWLRRDIVADADGVISPRELPYARVVAKLAPASADHVRSDLPAGYRMDRGVFISYPLAGRVAEVSLSNVDPVSFATASAGAHLAASLGSVWQGEAVLQPVIFGVERPTRLMELQRPMLLDAFPVRAFFVRTGDDRGRFALPTDPPADPDEIVVAASGKGKQKARLALDLGVDRLGGCSAMMYDKALRRLSLWCPPAEAAAAGQ